MLAGANDGTWVSSHVESRVPEDCVRAHGRRHDPIARLGRRCCSDVPPLRGGAILHHLNTLASGNVKNQHKSEFLT